MSRDNSLRELHDLLPPANWTDSYRQVPSRAEPKAASRGGSRGSGQLGASRAGRVGSGVNAAIGSGSRGLNATARRGTQPGPLGGS
eukprot:CAMPEP_0118948742 /NCGR_PEP_ID=MMETSP1169-20130426/48345_1 /TAXON_ID=36882 /ORGANISM="Pyramimonas obovata, Strain CCMP722" /LENGTH=85 /DNA_ID=CAMNT_0006895243 /DNA_START=198 /DNA_END=451 /DNA_ORIENTATION=+